MRQIGPGRRSELLRSCPCSPPNGPMGSSLGAEGASLGIDFRKTVTPCSLLRGEPGRWQQSGRLMSEASTSPKSQGSGFCGHQSRSTLFSMSLLQCDNLGLSQPGLEASQPCAGGLAFPWLQNEDTGHLSPTDTAWEERKKEAQGLGEESTKPKCTLLRGWRHTGWRVRANHSLTTQPGKVPVLLQSRKVVRRQRPHKITLARGEGCRRQEPGIRSSLSFCWSH